MLRRLVEAFLRASGDLREDFLELKIDDDDRPTKTYTNEGGGFQERGEGEIERGLGQTNAQGETEIGKEDLLLGAGQYPSSAHEIVLSFPGAPPPSPPHTQRQPTNLHVPEAPQCSPLDTDLGTTMEGSYRPSRIL